MQNHKSHTDLLKISLQSSPQSYIDTEFVQVCEALFSVMSFERLVEGES